jgi:hypothetical protein
MTASFLTSSTPSQNGGVLAKLQLKLVQDMSLRKHSSGAGSGERKTQAVTCALHHVTASCLDAAIPGEL